jgi:hypothetical protein
MAKSKRRIEAAAQHQTNREAWKSMSPEKRKEWNEHRARTAQTGYAKRQRERANGRPMSDRRHETPAWTLRAFGESLQRAAVHHGLVPEAVLS